MIQKKIQIFWLNCKSCELILEEEFTKNIKWIIIDKIDHKNGYISFKVLKEKDIDKVKDIILEKWYFLENNKLNKNTFFDYIIIFLLFILVWILALFFSNFEFIKMINFENMTLALIFLIWIVASLSSCLAITWWIVIWFSRFFDNNITLKWKLKTQLMFHLWRILSFFIFWWLLWIFWKYLENIGLLSNILLFLVWFLMVYMWFYMLNIFPSITKLWLNIPNFITKKIINIKNPKYAVLIWGLTFFIPCWFTIMIQLQAIASSSFIFWGLIMSIFALWTMPVLFLIWLWSSYFKDKKFDLLNKFIAIIVIYFWIFTLNWFANLISFQNNQNQEINIENLENTNIENLVFTHNWWSLNQKTIILEQNKNYKLNIIPEKDWYWCMINLTIPGIDNNVYLVKKWVPITINILNVKKWKYNIVCWTMWMKQWEIIIQ